MRVYKLRAQSDRYQSLILARGDDWAIFDQFTGKPHAHEWIPVAVRVFRHDSQKRLLPAGDFPSLATHVPVFSHAAATNLKPFLEPHGELLPLQCSEGEYFAFNVTRVIDGLDLARSKVLRFEDGEIMDVVEYEFCPDRIRGLPIFKIVEVPEMDVFVSDEFRQVVEMAGLKGFDFREAWTLPVH